MTKAFVGVVLAGGKSSRMGKDKALLEYGGRSLIKRAERLLNDAGASRVLISRNDTSNPKYLPDIYPNCGPMSGLHAAMMETKLPLLIVPVDMPMLTSEMLRCLIEIGVKMEASIHYDGFALPLFLWNTPEAQKYVANCLTKPNSNKQVYSLTRFISTIGAAQITCHQQYRLINTNTPEDWQKLTSETKVVSFDSYRKKGRQHGT